MYIVDTETCGFHGPTILIQYQHQYDTEVSLHNVWYSKVRDTLELIEQIVDEGIIGFNLAFDWFHLCQTYTTLKLLNPDYYPSIVEYALAEEKGRFGKCLKPSNCFDIMLHARRGKYQTVMDRKPIRIKKVPIALVYKLRDELDKRIQFPDIYFARKQDPTQRWKIRDIKNDLDEEIEGFKDLVLDFAPSSSLKALAIDTGVRNEDDRYYFQDIDINSKFKPVEFGYAPYALAPFKHKQFNKLVYPSPDNWYGKWPQVIQWHIDHWTMTEPLKYAVQDVEDTRGLYEYFGYPEPNDLNSILSCMVGALRWSGYSVDTEKLKELRDQDVEDLKKCKVAFNSARVVKYYISQVMSPTEELLIRKSTKSQILESIAKWTVDDVCECSALNSNCKICGGTGLVSSNIKHPAAERALEILSARHKQKEIEIFDKLIEAGRFHASFKVVGTLSDRMAGADNLNPQAIKKQKDIRAAFGFSTDDEVLCGGDWDSFEVNIADALWYDENAHNILVKGEKLHCYMGMAMYPGHTYDEIKATDGLGEDKDLYTRGKRGVFLYIYGGNAFSMQSKIGIDAETSERAIEGFSRKFPGWAKGRDKIFEQFASLKQEKGIGTKVTYTPASDYVESLYGFKRYFTLENRIIKELYDLSSDPPKDWLKLPITVVRREREQTVGGAVRSALLAAAFQIQGRNQRAAGNHRIQSTGATLTKMLQKELWDLQPIGIHTFKVKPFNVHDEIMCPCNNMETAELTKDIIDNFVIKYRKDIPLLKMDWKIGIKSWGEK